MIFSRGYSDILRMSEHDRALGNVRASPETTIDTPNASKSLSFRNQSIEDSGNLPDPDIIAQEIVRFPSVWMTPIGESVQIAQ
jgi:hypothetical protein